MHKQILSTVLDTAASDIVITDRSEDQIINDYKKLNDKCDQIISKIKVRKDKKTKKTKK